jgi:hypothetical protein
MTHSHRQWGVQLPRGIVVICSAGNNGHTDEILGYTRRQRRSHLSPNLRCDK